MSRHLMTSIGFPPVVGEWKKGVRARDVEDFEKMNRICSVDEKNEILYVPAVSIRRLIDNKGI
jgi:hypothetical protein